MLWAVRPYSYVTLKTVEPKIRNEISKKVRNQKTGKLENR